ncbi:MAG TPA: endonuclease/exonuclease/phosphatase family protein [Myxococcales bacterium]|nr:endonuclease/exonuclease/phosphatase family protein [Myxococcales bacterium]
MDRRPLLLTLGVALCGAGAAACLLGRDTLLLGSALWFLRWPLATLSGLLALGALRGRPMPLLALGALATAGALSAEWVASGAGRAAPQPVPARDAFELTVLTHNVLFTGGDPDATVGALVAADADVVALQEVTPAWAARLERALRADHPYALLEPYEGALGYALYSRYPLTGPATLRPRGHHGFAQCARLELPPGPVPICNLHLSPPPLTTRLKALEANARTRAAQWERVKAFLDMGGGRGPALAVGDLNTGDYEPLYRRISSEFIDAAGSVALLPARTFPNPALSPAGVGPLVRIDYVLARGGVQPLDVTVGRVTGSDHLPVRAVLRLRGAR